MSLVKIINEKFERRGWGGTPTPEDFPRCTTETEVDHGSVPRTPYYVRIIHKQLLHLFTYSCMDICHMSKERVCVQFLSISEALPSFLSRDKSGQQTPRKVDC